jgi:stage IV sporulation protein B
VIRGEERINFNVTPIKDAVSGRFKIGVLIRDGISGIGTVTYIDKENGSFGALGHAVISAEEKSLSLSNGDMYSCNIVGISKGVRGKAGELRGMFLAENVFGKAEKLCQCGIYGQINEEYDTSRLESAQADSDDVKMGKATIYSTISGIVPKEYQIEIVKVDKSNKENKNYVIKITDKDLLNKTGGILQGMSGSPIIQNGKLVGAVTHVFLNDSSRGFGISINNMLNYNKEVA